jgi:protein-S-isoprenylcysteine O-methyltransferase Ste14
MGGFHWVLPLLHVVSVPWNLVGIIPLGLGVVINIIASSAFQQAETTIKPFEESKVLVTNGLYRLSRNPMYLGFVLILTGVATLLGTLMPYLVIPAFIILIERNFIRAEEQWLERKFGQHWREYRQQVRRWV